MHKDLRIKDPDAFYQRLIELHAGLSESDSQLINAKLILMMANEIGDQAVLEDILRRLKDGKDA